MKRKVYLLIPLCLVIATGTLFGQKTAKTFRNKTAVINSVEAHQKDLLNLSDQIWAFA